MSSAVFPAILALVLLAGLVAAIAWGPMRREQRLSRQLTEVHDAYAMANSPGMIGGRATAVLGMAAVIGRLFTQTGILSPKAIANLETTLASAGMRGGRALPIFVGCKALLLICLPLLALYVEAHFHLAMLWNRAILAFAAIAGLMLPDMVLRSIRKRYLASLERAMPDALDLLVLCAEAGLALEAGMARVAQEIRISSMPCSIELSLTHNELRILGDRRAALINLGKRTGLVSLQRLAGTLAQALQYGTPLGQALRALAAELRSEALTRYEGRAAKLPVLMTLPMIMFILPCVFLIVAGPAVLAIMDTLHNR
jgi:tight adherence protein C